MKFKVGDKVRIVKPFWNEEQKYKGNIVTISWADPYDDGRYRVKENDRFWRDNELEALEQVERQPVKIGNYIIEPTKNGLGFIYVNDKEITLKDLKLGDILTVRDGRKYIKVKINKAIDILDGCSWLDLTYYKNDLIEKCNSKNLDIMEVERAGVVIFERKEEKKEILDEQEKKYLRGVIRPFRNDIKSIRKANVLSIGKEYIVLELKKDDRALLPNFKKGTMYKGMELDKNYTLEELGL